MLIKKISSTVLDPLLVDDMFIELTDNKLGQGSVGFVFKGYVFPKSQTRFKQKTFAAVKVSQRKNKIQLTNPHF